MQEDFGWKLVHGDVFRAPTFPMLLSVFVGCGTQILCMTFIALGQYYHDNNNCFNNNDSSLPVFACLGFLSPPNRGAFMTAVLVC